MFKRIVKRDGKIVKFDPEKITDAIAKAGLKTEEFKYDRAKALTEKTLKAAGIENVNVVKSDTSQSSHYWSLINLGKGWYHVDCTPRAGDENKFFMLTDEELETRTKEYGDDFSYVKEDYPKRATESVQNKIDYSNGKIIE